MSDVGRFRREKTLSAGDNAVDHKASEIIPTGVWYLISAYLVLKAGAVGTAYGALTILDVDGNAISTPLQGPLWRAGIGINKETKLRLLITDTVRVSILNATAADIIQYGMQVEKA